MQESPRSTPSELLLSKVNPRSTNIGAHQDSLHLKEYLCLPLCENRLSAHQVPYDLSSYPTWEHIRIDYIQGQHVYHARTHYVRGQPQGIITSKDNMCTTQGLITSKDDLLGLITSRDNLHTMPGLITSKENLT